MIVENSDQPCALLPLYPITDLMKTCHYLYTMSVQFLFLNLAHRSAGIAPWHVVRSTFMPHGKVPRKAGEKSILAHSLEYDTVECVENLPPVPASWLNLR